MTDNHTGENESTLTADPILEPAVRRLRDELESGSQIHYLLLEKSIAEF